MLALYNRWLLLGILSLTILLAAAGQAIRARRLTDAAARREAWRYAVALLALGVPFGLLAVDFLLRWVALTR